MRPITPGQKRSLKRLIDKAIEKRTQMDLIAVSISEQLGISVDEACDCVNNCDTVQELLDKFGIEVLPESPTYGG